MSSIFGRLHLDGKPIHSDDLRSQQKALDHWRADDTGIWLGTTLGLGHLILYSTPESLKEKLPLHRSISNCTITADARIDNRESIYALLGLDTTAAKELPDSSLILSLYEKYGTDCVQHLIGDFAFAIWDGSRQQLFCARDQMGVKPFFYYFHHNVFAFATEKKGIMAMSDFDGTIDKDFFYNLTFSPPQQSATTTLYTYIRRLAPAHTLTLPASGKRPEIMRYWTLDTEKITSYSTIEQYHEELRHLFTQAVTCRLRTCDKIGIELSGGLDSSAILGAAVRYRQGLTTISSTHAADETDEHILSGSERKYIESAIKFNNIKDAVFVTENPWKDPLNRADLTLFVNDGLEMWESKMLLSVKHAAHQNNVRVLLSGFPGDEMLTYKGRHFHLHMLARGQYHKYFSGVKDRTDLNNRLAVLLPHTAAYAIHKANNVFHALYEAVAKTNAVGVPFRYMCNRNEAIWHDHYKKNRFKSYRHYLVAKLLKPQVGLRMETETRFGLHYRLEPRFPQADIRLTQFFLSLPDDLKHSGNIDRNLYRNAVASYLPDDIYNRRDKTSNMAPYLFTKESMERVRKSAIDIAHEIKGKQNLLDIRRPDKANILPLTMLRWLQKRYSPIK